MSAPSKAPIEPEYDWIQLSMDLQDPNVEQFSQKMWRKTKANPFVPIGKFHLTIAFSFCAKFSMIRISSITGALGATGALMYGLWSMKKNDPKMSQLMVS